MEEVFDKKDSQKDEEITIEEVNEAEEQNKQDLYKNQNNLMEVSISEEDMFMINQLNARCMDVQKIFEDKGVWPPIIMPTPTKTYFSDKSGNIIMEADWCLIGEFRIFYETDESGKEDSTKISFIEFCWAYCLWPDQDKSKESHKVAEFLPENLHKIKDSMFRSPDIKIIKVISAYSFECLKLEYLYSIFNNGLQSRGLFGFKNLNWKPSIKHISDLPKNIPSENSESSDNSKISKVDNIEKEKDE